jgi:hypothetical protein
LVESTSPEEALRLATKVTVPELEAQPDNYIGKWIEFVGTVGPDPEQGRSFYINASPDIEVRWHGPRHERRPPAPGSRVRVCGQVAWVHRYGKDVYVSIEANSVVPQ